MSSANALNLVQSKKLPLGKKLNNNFTFLYCRDKRQTKDKHLQGKQEFKKMVSAGIREKLKKKGLFQNRDSKQEELGGSLRSIAGYDSKSRAGGSGKDTGSDKGLWDKTGNIFKGKREDTKKAIAGSHITFFFITLYL